MRQGYVWVLLFFLFCPGIGWAAEGPLKITLGGEGFIPELNPWDALKVGKDGRIYIADRHHYQIQVFSAAGEFLSAFGGRGEGPGFFKRWFGEFDIGPEGNVYQVDYWGGNRSISVFDPSGRFVRRFKIDLAVNFGVGELAALGEDRFLLGISRDQLLKRMGEIVFMGSNVVFVLADKNGKILREFFREFEYHSFSYGQDRGWPNIPYGVNLLSRYDRRSGIIAYQKNHGDQVYFHHLQSGRKNAHNNGFQPVAVTRDHLREWIDTHVKDNRRMQFFKEYYRKLLSLGRTVEEYQPIVSGMVFDAAGNLHVFSVKSEEGYQVSVVSPDRGLLRRYQALHPPCLITDRKTYSLIWDDREELYTLEIRDHSV